MNHEQIGRKAENILRTPQNAPEKNQLQNLLQKGNGLLQKQFPTDQTVPLTSRGFASKRAKGSGRELGVPKLRVLGLAPGCGPAHWDNPNPLAFSKKALQGCERPE